MDKGIIPILTIAGSDCSGGAGIQADIKTISALGCYAMSAVTALTAQNTLGVRRVEGVSPEMVGMQIDAVYDDILPAAVKTGMLWSRDIVATVADAMERRGESRLVVDPVMISTSGHRLIDEEAMRLIRDRLMPLAALVTPNAAEARWLTGDDDPRRQCRRLIGMGCKAVIVKGGDRDTGSVKLDLLMTADGHVRELESEAVDTPNTHGTGCTYSAAIASYLGMGHDLYESVSLAKRYIQGAINANAAAKIGHGHGPVAHFWQWRCS